MAIPLFSPDYLASPTAGGAINPRTAQMFIDEGNRLIQRIEKNSAKAEAEAKAPAIATAYAEGLSAIHQGDMSGFDMLARASAESVSNPFLASMTKGAIEEGVRAANNFTTSQLREREIESRQNMNAYDNEMALERARVNSSGRSTTGVDRVAQRQAQVAYLKERDEYDQIVAGENEKAKIQPGYKPNIPPEPRPPSFDLPQSGVEQGGDNPLFAPEGESNNPAQEALPGLRSASDWQDAPIGPGMSELPAEQPPIVNENQQTGQPRVNNQPVNTQTGQVVQPTINKEASARPMPSYSDTVVSAQMGNMIISMPRPEASGGKVVKKLKLRYGEETYHIPAGDDTVTKAWDELARNSAIINGTHAGFAEWSSNQLKRGDKIEFGNEGGDKSYFPVTVNGEKYGFMQTTKQDGKEVREFVKVSVGKDVVDAWKAKEAAAGVLKNHGMKVSFAEPKYNEDQKTVARSRIVEYIKSHPEELDAQNKILNEGGMEPIKNGETEVKTVKKNTPITNDDKAKVLNDLGIAAKPSDFENPDWKLIKDFASEITDKVGTAMGLTRKGHERRLQSLEQAVKDQKDKGSSWFATDAHALAEEIVKERKWLERNK